MNTSEIFRVIFYVVFFAGLIVFNWFMAYRWSLSPMSKFMFWFLVVIAIIVLIVVCAAFEFVFWGIIITVLLGGVCFFAVRTMVVNAAIKKFKEEAKHHDKTQQEYAKIKFRHILSESCDLKNYDEEEFKKMLDNYLTIRAISYSDAHILYCLFRGELR